MSLELDERQRAMLGEMGLRVFLPLSQAERVDSSPSGPLRKVAARPASEGASEARAPGPVAPPVQGPGGIDRMEWEELSQTAAACRACPLCNGRRNTVFGAGDRQADWLIVGDAPGEGEDLQGDPFVGQAGQLLDNMLKALNLNRRQNVYLVNALKCRPPGNRNPEPEEVAQCEPFLRRQVELLQPRVILAMGRFAVQALLQSNEPIGKLRGQVHRYNGVPVVVTFHPAYLLRNLPEKARAWADLCLALEVLEQPGRPGSPPVPG